MELIKVTTNQQGERAVSAKNLYDFLEVKTDFSKWCQRMFEYGFEEGKDFSSFLTESRGGRPQTDYALTLDTAKEIAMIQRSSKGKQARQYFIECERVAQQAIYPTQEDNALLPHTTRPVQIESSKGANAFSFSKGGKLACIDWSVKESLFFTGKRPSELKAIAKERGVPLKNRTSGKEVVRYYRPEVASAMSIADTLYQHGIEDTTALNAAKSAIPALQLLGQIEAQKLLSTKN